MQLSESYNRSLNVYHWTFEQEILDLIIAEPDYLYHAYYLSFMHMWPMATAKDSSLLFANERSQRKSTDLVQNYRYGLSSQYRHWITFLTMHRLPWKTFLLSYSNPLQTWNFPWRHCHASCYDDQMPWCDAWLLRYDLLRLAYGACWLRWSLCCTYVLKIISKSRLHAAKLE